MVIFFTFLRVKYFPYKSNTFKIWELTCFIENCIQRMKLHKNHLIFLNSINSIVILNSFQIIRRCVCYGTCCIMRLIVQLVLIYSLFPTTLVIEQFESWLEEFKRLNGTYPSLSKQTILEAINAVADQKNIKLITKVVNIYRGIESKEILICIVKNHYLKSSFATACRLAIALQLFRHFEIQDFILPLIVQDKLPLAEEYLSYNVDMQKATISLLDKHLEHPHDVLPLIS